MMTPNEYDAIGATRSPGGYKSATTALPIAIGAPPIQPAKKRKAIKASKLGASAHAIVRAMYRIM
jgi:hypothetical protein